MTVSCMHIKNVHYNRCYRNNSVIVELAMGQIPRSTERISIL